MSMMVPIIFEFIVSLCCGFWLGTYISKPKKPSGVLKIDHSNPDKDLYLFEIDDLDKISEKSYVILKIDNNADLSQQ